MKKTFLFVSGFIVGAAISLLLLYSTGLVLETLEVQLYESEPDQQRNFNIFIVSSVVVSILSGFFAIKKFT